VGAGRAARAGQGEREGGREALTGSPETRNAPRLPQPPAPTAPHRAAVLRPAPGARLPSPPLRRSPSPAPRQAGHPPPPGPLPPARAFRRLPEAGGEGRAAGKAALGRGPPASPAPTATRAPRSPVSLPGGPPGPRNPQAGLPDPRGPPRLRSPGHSPSHGRSLPAPLPHPPGRPAPPAPRSPRRADRNHRGAAQSGTRRLTPEVRPSPEGRSGKHVRVAGPAAAAAEEEEEVGGGAGAGAGVRGGARPGHPSPGESGVPLPRCVTVTPGFTRRRRSQEGKRRRGGQALRGLPAAAGEGRGPFLCHGNAAGGWGGRPSGVTSGRCDARLA